MSWKRNCRPLMLLKDIMVLFTGFMIGILLVTETCNESSCDVATRIFKRHETVRIRNDKNDNPKIKTYILNARGISDKTGTGTPPPLSKLVRPKTLSQEVKVKKPLLIGVVTAQTLLRTRATAVYKTWGSLAPKILFFSSPGNNYGLPVINLPGVDDTYPPQKKVYYMLKYVYDNFLDEFNWFLRADDDVYVRIPELIEMISQLDPTEPLYLGQPGLGKPEDRERLKLFPHERYCMGGPGILFSNGLLKLLGPHLEDCLRNVVVSYNEDVEVGRCISRRAGVQCSWSYQMAKLFFMDYSKGKIFNSSEVYKHKVLPNVLTVHSFKQPQQMFLIHQFFLEQKVRETMKKIDEQKKELAKWQGITKRTNAYG